ncbi:energy-coupling factor transporter transmembrane component T [Ruminococcus flavefaciens]|uniref:Energy-coupling factor transport system permease protein n=1 Tax=Ruminococcus flavefaciens TaxID=1265 RepID=A0A1M7K4Q3_RUMFL|nr:energy-coupling factor transporter transmembrane component T [Ruminococcus flavefaciens]SHM60282.1 energy-coupling factor transport system permease protein [Ruminococcus flavefaciens]
MTDDIMPGAVHDRKGVVLDPRTKLLLLLMISVFSWSSIGGRAGWIILPVITLIPVILLYFSRKWKGAVISTLLFLAVNLISYTDLNKLSGGVYYIILMIVGIFGRLMPCIIMAYYLVYTTTVSEFVAAMEKMHVSEKITIPFSVIFRFFPTVREQMHFIKDAMDMRGIKIGGKHSSKYIEYRLIPLMICSVKTGDELSAASLTRCLGGSVRRTNICKIGFGFPDYVIILILIASVAASVIVRLV